MEQQQVIAGIAEAKDASALCWLMVCAALVFIMQAGFCCLESGTVRFKNSINVALKNLIDLCCSFAAFAAVGYSLMFGASVAGVVGTPVFFLADVDAATAGIGLGTMAMFLFQATFCSTAATIVSGGVAERCRFMPYVIISIAIGLVIYPVFGHWTWGGGWLSAMGYHDFAGSSVVHLLGAVLTLIGIGRLGARAGRFDREGRPQAIPPSSMPMATLGAMLLAFGWIGFNGGSAPLGPKTASIIVNTLTAGCFAGLAAMLFAWATRGLAQADIILNGMIGGLVAITAGADVVSVQASAVIGILGGGAVVLGTIAMERLRLDDAVGAVPAHGVAGIVGVLAVAPFATEAWIAEAGMTRWQCLGVQAAGVGACIAWAGAVGWLMWRAVALVTPLRIGPDEELVGMNYSEHRVADPLMELAAAATLSASGREATVSLDHVREGDLVPLAKAIEALIARQSGSRREAAQWAAVMRDVRAQLVEQQHLGASVVTQGIADLGETSASLGRVQAFLDHHRGEDPFVPVLGDLVRQLRARLDASLAQLPKALHHFDQVKASAARMPDGAARPQAAR